MPTYLVEVRAYTDRFSAEVTRDRLDHDPEDEVTTSIHDTPPVVLSGLVKGGEYATVEKWAEEAAPSGEMWVSADGRLVLGWSDAYAANVRGALPISWYRYEEPCPLPAPPGGGR